MGKITVESEKATTSDDSCVQLLADTPFVRQNKHPRIFLSLNITLLVVLAKIRGLESKISLPVMGTFGYFSGLFNKFSMRYSEFTDDIYRNVLQRGNKQNISALLKSPTQPCSVFLLPP